MEVSTSPTRNPASAAARAARAGWERCFELWGLRVHNVIRNSERVRLEKLKWIDPGFRETLGLRLADFFSFHLRVFFTSRAGPTFPPALPPQLSATPA